MSLSINDASVFSAALKKARQKRKLTQAECAELLDHSVSFQKDLERGRCSHYAMKRAFPLLWQLQLYLQARIRMPCLKYNPGIEGFIRI